MSRNISSARHRAETDGNLALQGLSRAAKSHATAVGRPVAIVAVTSGLALGTVGTAHAGEYSQQGTTTATAAVAAPAAPAAAAPAAAPSAAGTAHTVVAGDTLGGISARYGADLTAVLAVNGLSLQSIIFPGDTVVIPTDGAPAAPEQTVSVQTVSVPVAAQPAPVQQAAAVAPAPAVSAAPAVAPAPAVSAAPESGVYLASADITPIASSSGVAGILLGSAQSQIGATQDCTVLVEKALRAAGIPVGDLGPSQFFQFGATVATPAPGDIVITGGHVAIYVGGGQVISSGMNGINATMQHPLSDLPGASFVRVAG